MTAPVEQTILIEPPIGLLAEFTHRCPLACPYCSNPLTLEPRANELDTPTWKRLLSEAAEIGVLHVHLSGGEPCARSDLVEIAAHCTSVGLYTNLITSGVGLSRGLFNSLLDGGLDHLQLSIQDVEATAADRIAGYEGAFAKKREVAQWVTDAGLPLTVNAVMHRANVANAGKMVEFAVSLGARRVEIAHTQYYGWALPNRAALMPSRDDAEIAIAEVERLREKYLGDIVIDHVLPDYHARYPKPCMSGWARRTINITPSGEALPCHAAATLPGLEFWNVSNHSIHDIWYHSPAFNAYRGTDWMKEPCVSCTRRDTDFGGCRCQALALTGDAREADPICTLSPFHNLVTAIANEEPPATAPAYIYRRLKA